MEKISLNGRVRMTLKPLMDEMPIVAAIQVWPADYMPGAAEPGVRPDVWPKPLNPKP